MLILVITFDSEAQMTSSFDNHASFDEIFHRIPIIAILLHNLGRAKWPKMTIFKHFGHLAPPHICNNMTMIGILSKISSRLAHLSKLEVIWTSESKVMTKKPFYPLN